MAHPDRTDPAGRDENAPLAQLVGDPNLTVGRIFDGLGDNRVLGFETDPVLEIGRPARPLQQRLDAAILDRVPVAVERVARQAHHLSRLRHVAKLVRQIEKADYVFDDLFITLKHKGYLSLCFDGWVRTAIKTGNPHPNQGRAIFCPYQLGWASSIVANSTGAILAEKFDAQQRRYSLSRASIFLPEAL